MIVLDTHVWAWWTHGDKHLTNAQAEAIESNERHGLGISVISCREIAKLVERKRLELPCAIDKWFSWALDYPGVQLLHLTPEIAAESCRLPGTFHRDPADQIIVATCKELDCPLVTSDNKLLAYPFVETIC